jgi:hypothetical protein
MPKYYKQHLLAGKSKLSAQAAEDQYYDELGPDPVRTLLSWHAPSRPYHKRDRSYYTTATILIILVSLIALIAGQFMLIGTLFAFLFLVYVLNFVTPERIEYKISTQGITIGDHFYHWQELDSFWFTTKDGYTMLHVVTLYRFPAQLILVLGDVPEDDIRNACARFIPFHEIAPKSQMDKWSESLQKHFPLETPHR